MGKRSDSRAIPGKGRAVREDGTCARWAFAIVVGYLPSITPDWNAECWLLGFWCPEATWIRSISSHRAARSYGSYAQRFRNEFHAFFRYAQDAIQASANSDIERVIAYGVASVFTPPQHRLKGYGQHMMRLLHHILAPKESLPPFPAEWGAPPTNIPPGLGNARASVLYSDIGDKFYRNAGPDLNTPGWTVTNPCQKTVWDTTPAGGERAVLQILQEDSSADIMERDAEVLLAELPTTTEVTPGTTIRFAFLPTPGLSTFQTARYQLNSPTAPGTDTWGTTTAMTQRLNFATWTFDPREDPPLLTFTRLRCDVENLAPLLDTAKIVSRKLGLKQIEVWNLPPHLAARAESLGGKTSARTDHLSSIAWYGGGEPQNVEWVLNEK